jgi:DNA-directed RNA polymerase specialized sigma24 family protein
MATNPAPPSPEQYWEQCEKRAFELLLGRVLCLEEIAGYDRGRYLGAWFIEFKQFFMDHTHIVDTVQSCEQRLEGNVADFMEAKIVGFDRGNRVFDEELVRLANNGVEEARRELLERYSPRIKKIVAGIVYQRDICPPSQDIPAYIEDVAQNVCVRITEKLSTYRFEQPFDHWVKAICTHEAYGERRDVVGRAEGGPRTYISWEDFEKNPGPRGMQRPQHLDILFKILDQHRGQSERGQKSYDAIIFKYYEDLDTEEVAKRLKTTKGYLYQLLSHDYAELRRIGIDQFGISGTDL